MSERYFDAHCHIQLEDYEHDQLEIIERMREEGVSGIVVGVDEFSSRKALALAKQHDHLYAAVGLHPNRVGAEAFDYASYEAMARERKVVAIGECGLDNFRPTDLTPEVQEKQREILRAQIRLAAAVDKPLIIHARPAKGTQDAYHDLITFLAEGKAVYPNIRGDIHFFVGGIPEMEALVALGFTVSFTAVITFARDYDAVIRATPLSSILSETDAPYVAPASRRRERNDPMAVADVITQIAEIRGEDRETVRQATLENAKRLFLR